jgi:dihydroneopterin aldolase
MMEINLSGAEFFAYHGYYPEEQVLGNQFVVDISVSFKPVTDLKEDDLQNTLNYEQLYTIACEEMLNTRKLLETVAQAIIDRIRSQYSFVAAVKVSVKKMNPPLKGKVASTSVTISYNK